MRLVYQKRALARLRHIAEWIERDNPVAARRVVLRIEERIGSLTDYPHQGKESLRTGIRELVITRTPYIVHYRVEQDRVVILTIRHGAQKPLKTKT